MTNIKQSVTRAFSKATKVVVAKSPLVLTVAGVVGLTATAVLAYKAAPKIEAVLDHAEQKEQGETPMSKREIVFELGKAVALPAVVGAASVCAVSLSYFIMNNRVKNLSSALSTVVAEAAYYRQKYVKENGEEKAKEFFTPTHEEKVMVKGKNGKEKEEVHQVTDKIDSIWGAWFTDSSEYCKDDHGYNLAYIAAKEEIIQNKLFRNGYVVLNDIFDNLGLPRTRMGNTLGFSTEDTFTLEAKTVWEWDDEMQQDIQKIWLSWGTPREVTELIDFEGRYSN